MSREACALRASHAERRDGLLFQQLPDDIEKSVLILIELKGRRAKDTRDETLGILGYHSSTIPYQALIGDMLINFYASSSRAHSFCRQHHLPEEDLNEGQEPEKIGELDFIEFWRVKRQILSKR